MADEDFKGTVCPAGHMCKLRTFREEHACDMCDSVISKGTSCRTCDFDLCHNCAVPARFTYERVSPADPAATIPIIVGSESTAAPLPLILPVSEEPTTPCPVDTILVSAAVFAPIAPLMDTDLIPRMSRMKLRKLAAVAFLPDPNDRADPAPALAPTPEVPASTAIFRSLVSSILVILATVDARTRDLLKDELMASFLP